MNRQQLPLTAADADMSGRSTEIRMPARPGRHDSRNGREVFP